MTVARVGLIDLGSRISVLIVLCEVDGIVVCCDGDIVCTRLRTCHDKRMLALWKVLNESFTFLKLSDPTGSSSKLTNKHPSNGFVYFVIVSIDEVLIITLLKNMAFMKFKIVPLPQCPFEFCTF